MPAAARRVLAIAGAIPLLAIGFAFSLGPSPEKALHRFYTEQAAEDQLLDPLLLAGADVVPLVVAALPERSMPRRRYAIAFLGQVRARAALPALERITRDGAEADYFRADALSALSLIDARTAGALAAELEDGPGLLGRVAAELRAGKHTVAPRTWAQAAAGAHD